MRFKIERASIWEERVQPCSEAVKGTMPDWDRRTCKSPEEFDTNFNGMPKTPWLAHGTEHGYIYDADGKVIGIKRRMADRPAWFVELRSSEELAEFAKKYGRLVVAWEYETPTIQIKDDY